MASSQIFALLPDGRDDTARNGVHGRRFASESVAAFIGMRTPPLMQANFRGARYMRSGAVVDSGLINGGSSFAARLYGDREGARYMRSGAVVDSGLINGGSSFAARLYGDRESDPDRTSELERSPFEAGFPSPVSFVLPILRPAHIPDGFPYSALSEGGGSPVTVRYHGLRNCFITVAAREPMRATLTEQWLVGHARACGRAMPPTGKWSHSASQRRASPTGSTR